MKIEIQLVERDENGMVKRVEILFDHHLDFIFIADQFGEPDMIVSSRVANNSRYWLGRIWARAYAIFRSGSEAKFESDSESEPESVFAPVIEGENSQLILKF